MQRFLDGLSVSIACALLTAVAAGQSIVTKNGLNMGLGSLAVFLACPVTVDQRGELYWRKGKGGGMATKGRGALAAQGSWPGVEDLALDRDQAEAGVHPGRH